MGVTPAFPYKSAYQSWHAVGKILTIDKEEPDFTIRYCKNSEPYISAQIMVNHADKTQPAYFIPITFFGATALHVMKCVRPGNIVSVNGYIQMVKVKLTSFNGEPRIRDRIKVVGIAIGNIINANNLKIY